MTVRILVGDVRERLADIEDGSVQCVVTSPPYFGLRDYGTASWTGGDPACDHSPPARQPRSERPDIHGFGTRSVLAAQDDGANTYRSTCGKCGAVRVDQQIGLEPTLAEYIAILVAVFRGVRRVLHPTGTVWLNLGDSYARSAGPERSKLNSLETLGVGHRAARTADAMPDKKNRPPEGLKEKDLMMVPARVAIALQEPWERHVIPNLADRAWMAGLVDGEGCFTVQAVRVKGSINESHSVRLQVRMADVEAVERIVAITGLNQVTYDQLPPSYAASGQRPAQQWKISGDRMADIAADLYPYLTVKRRQALVAWNLQHLRDGQDVGRGKPVPEANMEKRRVLHDVMRRLNAREHVDIPSWCKEPEVITESGWYLRSSIIWAKKNCMPESVTDRPTSSHEHIFLLTKQSRYYYDAEAVREDNASPEQMAHNFRYAKTYDAFDDRASESGQPGNVNNVGIHSRPGQPGRNQRNVWHLATEPFPDAHFATFPTEIPRRCIKAGSREGDTVLDPFAGSGTTLMVADQLGRHGIGIELSQEYATMAEQRVRGDAPMFAEVETI